MWTWRETTGGRATCGRSRALVCELAGKPPEAELPADDLVFWYVDLEGNHRRQSYLRSISCFGVWTWRETTGGRATCGRSRVLVCGLGGKPPEAELPADDLVFWYVDLEGNHRRQSYLRTISCFGMWTWKETTEGRATCGRSRVLVCGLGGKPPEAELPAGDLVFWYVDLEGNHRRQSYLRTISCFVGRPE